MIRLVSQFHHAPSQFTASGNGSCLLSWRTLAWTWTLESREAVFDLIWSWARRLQFLRKRTYSAKERIRPRNKLESWRNKLGSWPIKLVSGGISSRRNKLAEIIIGFSHLAYTESSLFSKRAYSASGISSFRKHWEGSGKVSGKGCAQCFRKELIPPAEYALLQKTDDSVYAKCENPKK